MGRSYAVQLVDPYCDSLHDWKAISGFKWRVGEAMTIVPIVPG
jgi:hypothetical protein